MRFFEGVCLNSRHPGPRRVLGRCRAAVRGLDPQDNQDLRDPGMAPFLRVLYMCLQQKWLGPHSDAMFFDLFMDLSCKRLLLRAFLEDSLPEMLSKLDVLAEMSMKKSEKKTSSDSSGGPGRQWSQN